MEQHIAYSRSTLKNNAVTVQILAQVIQRAQAHQPVRKLCGSSCWMSVMKILPQTLGPCMDQNHSDLFDWSACSYSIAQNWKEMHLVYWCRAALSSPPPKPSLSCFTEKENWGWSVPSPSGKLKIKHTQVCQITKEGRDSKFYGSCFSICAANASTFMVPRYRSPCHFHRHSVEGEGTCFQLRRFNRTHRRKK